MGFLGDASAGDSAGVALSVLAWLTGESCTERVGEPPQPTRSAASVAITTMRNMIVPGERCRVLGLSRATVGNNWTQPRRVSRRATSGRLTRVPSVREQCAEVARRGRGVEPERPRPLNLRGETKESIHGAGARAREASTRQRHIGYCSRYRARYRDVATLSSRSRLLRETKRWPVAPRNRHKAE